MGRIAVISMVRNEADVIESFVRHCFSFADLLLLVDHMSVDGTAEILAKLQAEGLPLYVERFTAVEQAQSEVMNGLMARAFTQEGADLVLPLDADEFLIADGASAHTLDFCRRQLERLSLDKVYGVDWIRYLLRDPEQGTTDFLLARPCWREYRADSLQKVVIGREAFRTTGLFLTQGNHAACLRLKEGEQVLVPERMQGLHLAHFPWRSEAQARSKAAVGWISNLAKYSPYTNIANHWRKDFLCLLQGTALVPQPLKRPVAGDCSVYGRKDGKPALLHYTTGRLDAFLNLLQAAEQIAIAYAGQKVLQERHLVSCLVPFGGDVEAFQHSLGSVEAESYPYLEVIAFAAEGMETDGWRTACQKFPSQVKVVERKEGKLLSDLLQEAVTGEYIQWVLPGDVLQRDKIWKMVEALEAQPNVTFVLSKVIGPVVQPFASLELQAEMDTGGDEFVLGDGNVLWSYLLGNGQSLKGGMSLGLFRRQLMERTAWLQGCFLDGRILELSFWGRVLPDSIVGCFAEPLVKPAVKVLDGQDVILLQMEWFYLLEEYGKRQGNVGTAEYGSLLRSFLEKQQRVQGIAQTVMPDLDEAYQQILGRVKASCTRQVLL